MVFLFPNGKENIPFHICFFMELILLNAENTLLFSRGGAMPQKNGYLTRLSLRRGETLQITCLISGQTYPFAIEEGFLFSSPHLKTWQGEGFVFLYVKPTFQGEGKWILGKRFPPLGNYPQTRKTQTEGGCALYTFHGEEGEHNPLSGRAFALFSPQNELIFYGKGNALRVEENTFTVTRVFPTHRRHETVTKRSLKTGEIRSYTARPTRWENPVLLPHELSPVLFAEELFLRAHPEDFLSRALFPRVHDLYAFLGEFIFALPWKEGEVLLFRKNGGISRVIFALREGLICDVEMEE